MTLKCVGKFDLNKQITSSESACKAYAVPMFRITKHLAPVSCLGVLF